MDPETAHETIALLSNFSRLPAAGAILDSMFGFASPRLKSTVCGIEFPNPVGMAAGFDKTGELYPFLSVMGFGCVESGTFTAHAQPGNPKPRLFRVKEEQALVNRMGFNNPGAEKAAEILARQSRRLPRGINIGKSKITELENAAYDYEISLRLLAPFGDYIAVNISSPNTPDLRRLQEKDKLKNLLKYIINIMEEIKTGAARLPLFVKIAPDMSDAELDDILEVSLELSIDGLILTNTTIDKSSVPAAANIEGGLSGMPLREKSTEFVRKVYRRTSGRLVIMGVGGILSGPDALEKILAGASLVQIYTGYIYQGPGLPGEINEFLDSYCLKNNISLSDLVGAENKS